jgi:hypothetical protein
VIPEILPLPPRDDWQNQLRNVISSAGQLLELQSI